MGNYNVIREALGDAIVPFLKNNNKANVYDYTPRTFVVPSAIISPVPQQTGNHLQTQGGSSFAKWQFIVTLIIGLVDVKAAQRRAGELASPGSVLIKSLNSTKLPNGYAIVTHFGLREVAASVSGSNKGAAVYTAVEVAVTVYS